MPRLFPHPAAALLLACLCTAGAAEKGPLPIADLARATPVDFEREVLPFLSDNCLSCHCQSTTKGGLNLETPELMLKGGESGPSVVPGKSAESLTLQAAAHLESDLVMPPRDNKAKAKNLTPEQLALLRLWIDQGAKPSPKVERVLQWQPLPESLQSILAVAVTRDGRFAACSRGNRLFVYDLPTGRSVFNEVAHRDQVNAIAFSPDGTLAATGGYREVKLWRRAPLERKLISIEAGARTALSSDGKWLATAGEDGAVKLFSWPDGKLARTIATGAGALSSMALSPDGAKLACAAGKALTLWNVQTADSLAKSEAPAAIASLAWLPAGQLATGSADGLIRLYSDQLAPVRELKGHAGPISALAAASRIVSAGQDGSLLVWDSEKPQPVLTLKHGAAGNGVAIRADGKRFASAGENGVTKLWDADGKPIAELRGNRRDRESVEDRDRKVQVETATVAFRKAGIAAAEKQVQTAKDHLKKMEESQAAKQKGIDPAKAALTQAQTEKKAADAALALAEAELKKAAEALTAADAAAQQATASLATLKAATPPDQAAIAQATTDAAAKTKAAVAAKTAHTQSEAKRKAAADRIAPTAMKVTNAEAALQRAEKELAAAAGEIAQAKADEQKTAAGVAEAKALAESAELVLKSATGDLEAARKQLAASEKPLRALAFSPDGRTLASAGDDLLVQTWSAETGAPCEIVDGHATPPTLLAFTPGGALLSAARNGPNILSSDLEPRWKLERTIGTSDGKSPFADRVNAVAFSPDGKLLATGGGEPSRGGEIKFWDPATGAPLRDFPKLHADAVLGLEFSPDGKHLATASADKVCRILDAATGKGVRSFEGHTHHVLAVSWSLDGRTVATAGADNAVKIWDFTTGDRKKNIDGYDKEVTAVRFSAATTTLLTSSGDNKVRLVGVDGKEVRLFPEVKDYMQSAAVTADGRLVVSGGQDSVLRIWNAADGKPVAAFAK